MEPLLECRSGGTPGREPLAGDGGGRQHPGHPPPAAVFAAQAGEGEGVGLDAVAGAAEQHAVGDVVEAAVGAGGVVVQLQVQGVVKAAVAAAADGAVLFHQDGKHLVAGEFGAGGFGETETGL